MIFRTKRLYLRKKYTMKHNTWPRDKLFESQSYDTNWDRNALEIRQIWNWTSKAVE
jgi:hypothetical protein